MWLLPNADMLGVGTILIILKQNELLVIVMVEALSGSSNGSVPKILGRCVPVPIFFCETGCDGSWQTNQHFTGRPQRIRNLLNHHLHKLNLEKFVFNSIPYKFAFDLVVELSHSTLLGCLPPEFSVSQFCKWLQVACKRIWPKLQPLRIAWLKCILAPEMGVYLQSISGKITNPWFLSAMSLEYHILYILYSIYIIFILYI